MLRKRSEKITWRILKWTKIKACDPVGSFTETAKIRKRVLNIPI